MTDPSYPAYPIIAFVSAALVLIPLPWHLLVWNSGTCIYMIWTAIGCLLAGINAILWHGNSEDLDPAWCYIATRIQVGSAVAIPAASFCINRRLYVIATYSRMSISNSTVVLLYAFDYFYSDNFLRQRRATLIVDLCIALGVPVLQMILQVIVQPRRYDVFEDIGCWAWTLNTTPAYALVLTWPIAISFISAVYSALVLYTFIRKRITFNQFVSSAPSTKSLNVSRYIRLIALTTMELTVNLAITSYLLFLNTTTEPIQPCTSWHDVHAHWDSPNLTPRDKWTENRYQVVLLEFWRWTLIYRALIFFAFFGFAEESRSNYVRFYSHIGSFVGKRSTSTSTSGTTGSIPALDKLSGGLRRSKPGTIMSFSTKERPTQQRIAESLVNPSHGLFRQSTLYPRSPSAPPVESLRAVTSEYHSEDMLSGTSRPPGLPSLVPSGHALSYYEPSSYSSSAIGQHRGSTQMEGSNGRK